MTNREWLNSLSNEDFIKWLLDKDQYNEYMQAIEPRPRLHTLSICYGATKLLLRKWLEEERK